MAILATANLSDANYQTTKLSMIKALTDTLCHHKGRCWRAAEQTPTQRVRSVTPERGAKDNRGGFLRQAESEAFLEVFQKRLRASRVRRFSHVIPNLARSQIHISRNSFAHFAKVNWRILHG